MLLALTHDLGKAVTTKRIDGRIHSYQHEIVGKKLARRFLERFVGEEAIIQYVSRMIPLHMKPNILSYEKASCKSTNKMYDEAPAPSDLIYLAMADRPVVSRGEEFHGDFEFLFERLEIFKTTMAKPYVTGKDLIALGISPGPELGNLLVLAHKLRLAGIPKDNAIKQVMSQRKSLRKTRLAEEQNK
jgi:tRNA nucleotidyltransferase (CCA-adding enzyme)